MECRASPIGSRRDRRQQEQRRQYSVVMYVNVGIGSRHSGSRSQSRQHSGNSFESLGGNNNGIPAVTCEVGIWCIHASWRRPFKPVRMQ